MVINWRYNITCNNVGGTSLVRIIHIPEFSLCSTNKFIVNCNVNFDENYINKHGCEKMPLSGTVLFAAIIGIVVTFFGNMLGPLRVVRKPLSFLGVVAVIALALAFIGYPQISDFVQANTITAFIMAVAVVIAGAEAVSELVGL